uniref:MABP domain-containing protein n=1 Tax=Podarcis muralis TaxID=64176 RepID=A0A670IG14_PODMU
MYVPFSIVAVLTFHSTHIELVWLQCGLACSFSNFLLPGVLSCSPKVTKPWTGLLSITSTVEGAPANFGKGFAQKSGYFLCSTSAINTEVRRMPGLRREKKRLCVKLIPLTAAETAVFDILLSSKNKVIPNYMRIGEMSGFALWCKKEHILKPKPLPKPRKVSLEMKRLSLEPDGQDYDDGDNIYVTHLAGFPNIGFSSHFSSLTKNSWVHLASALINLYPRFILHYYFVFVIYNIFIKFSTKVTKNKNKTQTVTNAITSINKENYTTTTTIFITVQRPNKTLQINTEFIQPTSRLIKHFV